MHAAGELPIEVSLALLQYHVIGDQGLDGTHLGRMVDLGPGAPVGNRNFGVVMGGK